MATNIRSTEKEVKPLLKLPQHVLKDGIKWTIMPAKVILDGVSLWPERQNLLAIFLTYIGFISLLFVIVGQSYHLYQLSDLVSSAFIITMFIVIIEAMARQFLINYHKRNLVKLLHTVYFEFWPSNIVGQELEHTLNKKSWYLILYCTIYTFSAFMCIVQLFFVPLFTANGYLTLLSTYPFAYSKSPLYEILHVWQFLVGELLVFVNCGVDFFFVSLLWNCIGQFVLLRNFLETEFKKSLLRGEKGIDVLLKCVKYHDKLIRTCKEMEDIFSYFILLLFCANVGTVCISCFIVTVRPQEIGTGGTYFVGHMCELFIYCYLGTQLIYESTALSDAVFRCGWHLSDNTSELRNSLLMLMVRSQREQYLTAGGFAALDMTTFTKVLKFSFSVYTLLNSILEKQD